MWKLFSGVLLVAALVGCTPASLRVSDYERMSDERLVEYYHQIQADIKTQTEQLLANDEQGRVVAAGVRDSNIVAMEKRRAAVWTELRQRGITMPALE